MGGAETHGEHLTPKVYKYLIIGNAPPTLIFNDLIAVVDRQWGREQMSMMSTGSVEAR